MAIASMTWITNIAPAQREKNRPVMQAAADEVRARDGCESFAALADGTDTLVVIIWRDQAAFDAYAKDRDQKITELEEKLSASGEPPMVGQPKLYEVDYWK